VKQWQIHPDAEVERDRAAAHYLRVDESLGFDFLSALQEAITILKGRPAIGTAENVGSYAVRHLRVRRFPFAIYVADMSDAYLVVAFAHVRRRPGYWKSRLTPSKRPPRAP
jgi:hypothetical protein